MNINNRRVKKENVTFYQWLNIFEMVTKNEFRTFQPEVQENLKKKNMKAGKQDIITIPINPNEIIKTYME